MPWANPYKAEPGQELDQAIHQNLFEGAPLNAPPYSTDEALAERIRSRLKDLYGYRVQIGRTRMKSPLYFARFESGASTSTEVLAETLPLAVCRLAMVLASKENAAAH